jgi:RimJ/RimL family protein N-acetyltransferase
VLTLRPPRPEDADALTQAVQDPEIPRWTNVPSPYTREHALDWIARRDPRVEAYLAFEDDTLVGSFSLLEIDRAAGYAEIGYWVAKEARGHGVATRAVAWLRERGAELGLTTFELLIHKDNVASQGVARRAGFEDTGERRPAPRVSPPTPADCIVYRRSDA